MASLSDKAENALNETRMLILGAQVLIGFGYQAAFQPGFDRLSVPMQELKLVGLGLMLCAVALLIAPGAFHQITESGNDTPRLMRFTGLIASLALLPFAIGLGVEIFIAVQAVLGPQLAIPLGVLGSAFALMLWYGLEWIWRARNEQLASASMESTMPEPTSLEARIKQVLTETRVVLPGVQALLGFQLTAMLTDAFTKLPKTSQYVHLVSLGFLAASMVFLMAPAAYHRIVEAGQDTERLHRFSSAMLLSAMVPLAMGLAGDFYVVLDKVLNASTVSISLACLSLVVFFGLWFGLTLAVRARGEPPRALRVSRAAR